MAERGCGGVLSNVFHGDCAILFFILVFLLLFVSPGVSDFGTNV